MIRFLEIISVERWQRGQRRKMTMFLFMERGQHKMFMKMMNRYYYLSLLLCREHVILFTILFYSLMFY
jgi:hypothetical protein